MGATTSADLGKAIRTLRRALRVTQDRLALTSDTNRRFIIELEKGKPTCQLGKALKVLQTLGATLGIVPPPGAGAVHGATKTAC